MGDQRDGSRYVRTDRISGASTSGLEPSDLTFFNGEALFNGFDATGHPGLWVTTGTAAGTFELTGISGTSTSFGLSPFDLTNFNGEVLFRGFDTAGHEGLWVTNGTAAGTFELTGISGANTIGFLNVVNPDFTEFDGEVLFNGTDAANQLGLG